MQACMICRKGITKPGLISTNNHGQAFHLECHLSFMINRARMHKLDYTPQSLRKRLSILRADLSKKTYFYVSQHKADIQEFLTLYDIAEGLLT